MSVSQTILITLLFLSTTISVALGVFGWRQAKTRWARLFTYLLFTIALWSFSNGLELSYTQANHIRFWAQVKYTATSILPIFFFLLTYSYYYSYQPRPYEHFLLYLIPTVTILLVWSNSPLFSQDVGLTEIAGIPQAQRQYGGWYWVHVIYSYILLFIGMLKIFYTWLRAYELYQQQAKIMLAGLFFPWMSNILLITGLISIDLTALAFTLSGIFFAWGLFRFRLFDVTPLAHRMIIDGMSEAILVTDSRDRIVDMNIPAERLLQQPQSAVLGSTLSQLSFGEQLTTAQESLDITHENGQTYSVQISTLHDNKTINGRVYTFRNISKQKQIESQLRQQKQFFETMTRITQVIASSNELQTTLQNILEVALSLSQAHYGSLYVLDKYQEVIERVTTQNTEITPVEQTFNPILVKEGLMGWALRHQKLALVNDTEQDERWHHLPGWTPKARSAIAMPIADANHQVLCVIVLLHKEVGWFTDEQATLLQNATQQMALAMRNAQLYEMQKLSAQRQSALYEVLRGMGQHLDLQSVAQEAVKQIQKHTNWSSIAISVADALGQKLRLEATTGILKRKQGENIPIQTSITGRIFRTGQTEIVRDVNKDPDVLPIDETVRQGIFVPLKQSEQRLGVLTILLDKDERALTHDDVLLAESLADAISLILDKARLYSNTRQYANDLNSLYRITSTLSQTLMQDQVLTETLKATLTALDFVGGLLAVTRNGRLHLETHRHLPDDIAKQMVPLLDNYYELHVLEDLQNRKRTPLEKLLHQCQMRTFVVLPIKTHSRLLGVLLLCHLEPRHYTVSHQSLYLSIGRQIATALTNKQLFEEIIIERSRLQSLIEATRDGILFIGLDKKLLVINEQALLNFNINSEPTFWVGQSIDELLTHLSSNEMKKQFVVDIAFDAPPIQSEVRLYNSMFEWVSLPVKDGERPLGRLWVFYDITKSRLLEQMRDDLMHTTVHDLRNPLLAQATALDMITAVPPEQKEILQVMKTSVNRMLNMVNTMLDINRLENEQLPIRFTILSIPMLLETVLLFQDSLIQQKQLNIQIKRPKQVPFAYGDDNLIERVLQNLVSNAIKFTPEKCKIIITIHTLEEELRIDIFNEGSYISPDLKNRLFQKFITGEHKNRGSGLGLAFCRMVLEAHGKKIWLESDQDTGTTFSFTLALASQDFLQLA